VFLRPHESGGDKASRPSKTCALVLRARGEQWISDLVLAMRLRIRGLATPLQESPSNDLPLLSRMIFAENRNGTFRNHAKKRRRSADKRIHWSPPRGRKESLPAYAASTGFVALPHRGSLSKRRPRLSAPHRGSAPKVSPSDSALGRASWNRRVQTGGPSPAPVQRAPRTPITRRRGRCPSRPNAQRMAALSGTAPAPP